MKKIMAILLTVLMAFSVVVPVSAADTDVAKIGETTYATLAAAVSAAGAGDTITLLADVNENVTIGKNITLDGASYKYTGNITTNSTKADVVIKNVNFVDCESNYAIKSNGAKSVTIENCTTSNCGWGLFYANKSTGVINVKNVVVDGGSYGLRIAYNNTTTLENVTMKNVAYGVYSQTFGKRTFTFKNCTIAATTAPFYAQDKGANIQTLNFKGNGNNLGIDVTTLASDLVKVNQDVAMIGTESYASINEAVAAAKDGDVIKVILDHEIASSQAVLSTLYTEWYVFAEVTDKKVTIDLNGKVVTINPELDNRLLAVFFAYADGVITVKDSSEAQTGAINVTAAEDTNVYSLFSCDEGGKFNIESGNYYLNKTNSWSMLYASYGDTFTVSGGNFVLGNGDTKVWENGESYPWIYNVGGDGAGSVTVTGGTYNIDPTHYHGETYYPGCYKAVQKAEDNWVVEIVHTEGAAATCMAAQTCTVCGTELDAIKTCTYETYVSDGNATCTVDGTKTAACIYGCGSTDTVADNGSAGGHNDVDGNGHCDGCNAEICDTCGRVHEDWMSMLICLIVDFINLVVSYIKSV